MKLSKSIQVSALCAVLALSGCNSTMGGSDPDPRLTNKEFSVNQSSYATACVSGAALTGIGCLFIAGKNKAVCLAAAAGGCAVFMGGNALLDNLRQNYHTKEQQLDALAEQMETNRQKAAYMVATANQVYEEDHAKLKQMQDEIKKNTADKAKLQKALARYDGNIAVLKDNISYHEKQHKLFSDTRNELIAAENLTKDERKKLKECDAEIARLDNYIKDMTASLESITQDRNVLNLAINSQGSEVKAS